MTLEDSFAIIHSKSFLFNLKKIHFLSSNSYESLQFTQSNSSSSLFVHVPSQSIIPVENQVKFVKELLEIIADLM